MSLSSVISYYVQNNEEPSSKEFLDLYRSRVKPKQELDNTKAEITRITAILTGLQEKHDELLKVVGELDIVLSPMRRLPVDVLREIFFFCLSSDHAAPLHLSRICKSWRSIILSTPMMWSNLYVTIGSPYYPPVNGQDHNWRILQSAKVARQATFLQEWINRSGECHLTVTINAFSNFSSTHNPILEVLMESCIRWKELYCSDLPHAKELWMRFVSILRESGRVMESLEILKLHSLDCDSGPGKTYPHGLDSKTMPYLHTLSILHHSFSMESTKSNLTESSLERKHPIWPHIRHLTINSCFASVHALQTLDMCPNIIEAKVSLTVHRYHSPERTPIPPHHTSMPKLKALCVRELATSTSVFYNALDTPNIEMITVYRPSTVGDQAHTALLSYIQRSPSLHKFVLELPEKSSAHAKSLANLVPVILGCGQQISHITLKSIFKLDVPQDTNTLESDLYTGQIRLLLRSLAINPPESSGSELQSAIPLPNLQTLELLDLPTADEDILAFIINRRRAGAIDPDNVAMLKSIKATNVISTGQSRIDFADQVAKATQDVLPDAHASLFLDISYPYS